jgi:WD40 repeat protein
MKNEGTILLVACSPTGKYVVSGSADGTIHVWVTESGKEVSLMRGGVDSIAFSPNSKYVVSVGGYTASVWEAETGKEVSQMKYEESYVDSAAFSPDSKYVVSAGDYSAKVWEVETGKEIASQGYARFGPSSPVT